MQRQMYQLSEDNTSGLPFPTDLSLPPLGNKGLEIPDRMGKDDSKWNFQKVIVFLLKTVLFKDYLCDSQIRWL